MANDKIAAIRVYHEAAFDRGAQEWDFVKLMLTDAQGRTTERKIMGCDTKTGADGAWYFLLYVMVDGYLLQGAPTANRSPLDFGVWKTTYSALLTASPARNEPPRLTAYFRPRLDKSGLIPRNGVQCLHPTTRP